LENKLHIALFPYEPLALLFGRPQPNVFLLLGMCRHVLLRRENLGNIYKIIVYLYLGHETPPAA
jgi:hypothetical protein